MLALMAFPFFLYVYFLTLFNIITFTVFWFYFLPFFTSFTLFNIHTSTFQENLSLKHGAFFKTNLFR